VLHNKPTTIAMSNVPE